MDAGEVDNPTCTDYQDVINLYNKEVHAYGRLLKTVRGAALGIKLNKEGKDLFNWPLHSMVNHVTQQMQFVWDEGKVPFGRTCLKCTEVRAARCPPPAAHEAPPPRRPAARRA